MHYRFLALIPIFLCIITCMSNTSSDENDSIIYDVINQVLDDSIMNEYSCDKVAQDQFPTISNEFPDLLKPNDPFAKFERMDSIFTKNDIEYMRLQLKEFKNFSLRPDLIQGKLVIPFDTLRAFHERGKNVNGFWELYRESFGRSGFCSVSMPLFSKDKKTVIVKIAMLCGNLCGTGQTNIYKLKNGKWLIIKTIDEWIS